MRYCHQCHRITAGEPLYCNSCGSSYGHKLCPSRHVNPRTAQVCSTCGSRDLSQPAPPLPWWLAPFVFAASLLPGIILALLLVAVVAAILQAVLADRQVQAGTVALLVVLGLLWFVYIHLPKFVRDMFRSLWSTKRRDGRPH